MKWEIETLFININPTGGMNQHEQDEKYVPKAITYRFTK